MTMRFKVSRCPVCEEEAMGTVECVPGVALLTFDAKGEAEYEGETKLDWDLQFTRYDDRGHVTLECSNGHQWQTGMHETAEQVQPTQCPACGKKALAFPSVAPTHCSAECYLVDGVHRTSDPDKTGDVPGAGAAPADFAVSGNDAVPSADRCPDSPTGRHQPDPRSIQPADGAGRNRGTDWIVDVRCIHCGRSGSTRIDPGNIEW